jgi:UTP--glucose-1-phosphate uridylyltransferase
VDIKKALITAAGRDQRTLPLQTLVNRDGSPQNALRIIVDEALHAGAEEVAVVIHPGDEPAYRAAAGDQAGRLRFIEQSQPRGYGHAVWCAREFTAGQPFLLLVGDHLYVSRDPARTCARQLVETAAAQACSVSGVQATHESKLPHYGTVGGRLLAGQRGIYEVREVREKPTPTEAEQKLVVPGLRAGHYLCFFGMHVITPAVMELLAEEAARGGSVPLTPALAKLAARERYLALEVQGRRYDIGAKYGLLTAQLALALEGGDREEVLAALLEVVAQRTR